MVGQRLRRWPTIEAALGQPLGMRVLSYPRPLLPHFFPTGFVPRRHAAFQIEWRLEPPDI